MPTSISKIVQNASRNSLSIRLLSYILICSTVLALLITIVQLAWDYRKDVAVIEAGLEQIEASFLQPIAASLWNLDEEQVQMQIEGIMNLPNMQYVMVKEILGNTEVPLISQGVEKKKYDISHEFDLIYQGETVGKLFVAASLEEIYQRLMEKSILILVSQTIKTLVVSICILLIIYSMIVRHLNKMANYTSGFNLDSLDHELVLDGRGNKKRQDELDMLASTLNQMRNTIRVELEARQRATEQLEQERDFSATIINSSNLVIACLGPDLKIVNINPAGIQLTGYREEDMLGTNWLNLFVSEELHNRFDMDLKGMNVIAEREIAMLDQQGNELILEWSFVPFYENDELKYMIGFGYDITPLKRVEREITQLNEQLEEKVRIRTHDLQESNDQLAKAYQDLKQAQQTLVEAEKMASLGSLVAGVAHEINTPIGISVTASSYLKEQAEEFQRHVDAKKLSMTYLNEFLSNLQESTNLMQSNLRRASDLISSFKQVAVDQSSEAHYTFKAADNLHQVVVSLGHKLKKAKCEVEVNCAPEIQLTSYPGSLTQIYSNLIINSIKHGFDDWDKPRKINIDVSDEGEMVNIDYHDNGRGIDAEVLPKIFDPFVTSKRGQGGSGLGTHIIYNLVVQLLRGRISCSSDLGEGVHFRLTIPKITPAKAK